MLVPKLPPGLEALQRGFAAAMRTPLEIGEAEGSYRLHPERYPAQLTASICPDRGQPGAIRLASYNRQYWFRLLTVMQEEYPLLRHLLGISDFNRMVIDYLTAHPSTSPQLRHLSDALGGFLAEHEGWGSRRNRQCARLEHAHIHAFDALHRPAVAMTATALGAPLQLQPHLSLIAEDWDLVDWRARARRDHDDTLEVTLTERPAWWAIWRHGDAVRSTRLGAHQHALLARIAQGETLSAACAGLAEGLDEAQTAFVVANIQGWFSRWAAHEWFC